MCIIPTISQRSISRKCKEPSSSNAGQPNDAPTENDTDKFSRLANTSFILSPQSRTEDLFKNAKLTIYRFNGACQILGLGGSISESVITLPCSL